MQRQKKNCASMIDAKLRWCVSNLLSFGTAALAQLPALAEKVKEMSGFCLVVPHRNVIEVSRYACRFEVVQGGHTCVAALAAVHQKLQRVEQHIFQAQWRAVVFLLRKVCRHLFTDNLESYFQQHLHLAKSRCRSSFWTVPQNAPDCTVETLEKQLFVLEAVKGVHKHCMCSPCKFLPAKTRERTSPRQHGFSRTSIRLQHSKFARGREALQVYLKIRSDEEMSARACVAALKICSSLKDLGRAKRIHADLVKRGLDADMYVATLLVHVYAKCGSLVDARNVFEGIRSRDVMLWNAMISGYIRVENGTEALTLYGRMQEEGVLPDHRTFVAVLKACCSPLIPGKGVDARKHVNIERVRAIHSQAVKSGYGSDVYVGNILVAVYAKCGNLVDARHVFDGMPHRDLVSWNSMISGYAQMDEGEEALKLFTALQQEGFLPDDRTFVAALKACSSLAGVEEVYVGEQWGKKHLLEIVRAIHLKATQSGSETALFVGTMLVDVYIKCGSLGDARQVFETMPHHDVVSWNAMILGYCQMDKGEEALRLYAQMQKEGVLPNERTFVAALKACSTLTLLEAGLHANAVRARLLKVVKGIHFQAARRGAESAVFVGTMLVDAYAKCGSLVSARHVFEKMPHRDVFTWNTMILAYAEMDEFEKALECYTWMQQDGTVSDSRTFVAALKACSGLAAKQERTGGDGNCLLKRQSLEKVKGLHANIVESGLETVMMVENALVDAYVKCGSLVDARRLFEKMPCRDVVSWTSMILGHAQMGDGERALEFYSQMQQDGVVPDARAFVGALKACESTAMLQMGMEIHAQISKTGLDASNPFVASSLIDMYGKCGSMVDAHKVFDSLPRRDVVTWSALIAGYADQGESDLVFKLLEWMMHDGFQPNSVTFSSVLTVCSHVGLVEKGQMYFDAMKTSYGVSPSLDHYTCLIDLLGRVGHIDKAIEIAKTMPYQADSAVWKSILGACRKWRKVELGRQAFEFAISLDRDDAAAYVLMSNIYSAAQMLLEAKEIRSRRPKAFVWKKPGQSWWTDPGGTLHRFVAGDHRHLESESIYVKVRELVQKMKQHGYVPHLESVLRHVPDDEKEHGLCGHSEKLALAHALLKTPKGTTVRITKNLRVCEDCHHAIALISKIELRTIVCRDASRFHVYKDGKCSCGNYW